MEQITRCRIPWERFFDLLSDPSSSWISGNIKVDDFSAFMINQNQNMEHIEKNGWNGEEIHSNDLVSMVF